MTGLIDYLSIAWPGLLVLAGFVALIVHANVDFRRRTRLGRYRADVLRRQQARDARELLLVDDPK